MAEVDVRDFMAVLMWIVYGPGAGTIAWWGMNKWGVMVFPEWKTESRRDLSIALAVVIALLFYGVIVWSGMEAPPGATFMSWWIKLWAVGGSAFLSSQIIHGKTNLRKADSDKLTEILSEGKCEDCNDSTCARGPCGGCSGCSET